MPESTAVCWVWLQRMQKGLTAMGRVRPAGIRAAEQPQPHLMSWDGEMSWLGKLQSQRTAGCQQWDGSKDAWSKACSEQPWGGLVAGMHSGKTLVTRVAPGICVLSCPKDTHPASLSRSQL